MGGAGGEESLLTEGEAKVQFTVRSPGLLEDKRAVMDRLSHKVGEEILHSRQVKYLSTYIPFTWNHDCFLSLSSEAGASITL